MRLPFLSVFKPFSFCPKGSPSVLVNGPDGEIKRARSLIVQEGSRQFGTRATYMRAYTCPYQKMGTGKLDYVYTVAFLLLIRTLIVTDMASVYTITAETQPKTQ